MTLNDFLNSVCAIALASVLVAGCIGLIVVIIEGVAEIVKRIPRW